MKNIKCLTSVAFCMTMLMACSSEEEIKESETKVPLEISIGNSARSIVEGMTIPYQTSFGIFGIPYSYSFDGTIVQDINNVSVFYDGQCTLSKDVLLDSTPIYIKAYYPYNKDLKDGLITINSTDQTDYLFGESVWADHPYYVDNNNPKTDIVFRHVLSRLTLKIKHTEKYGDDFKLTDLSMYPLYKSTQFYVYNGRLWESIWNNTWTDFRINMNVSKDFHTVDYLLIPFTITGTVSIMLTQENKSYDICKIPGKMEGGKQYSYEIIYDDNGIKVSEAVITPWESTTQPGIDITDNNLVTN